jgi:hypothetical protein
MVRLKQGDTVIWTKEKAYKTQIMYPKTEQALRSGVRYQWEIKTAGYPGVGAFFEIASDEEKKKVLDELFLLDTPEYKAVSISTIAVLKYGILISRGFSAEARNILSEAISADPDDPGLHMLMGDYYSGIGLKDLAAEEYDEAGFLMSVNQ